MNTTTDTIPFLGENNLAKNKYSRPDKLLDSPDAIVIGSGIGGMGIASILAQKKKWRVLLLEANPVPGGCTAVWEQDGFEWNIGIDSIGDMDPRVGRGVFRPTMDYITGGRLEWAKMPDIHEVAAFGEDEYDWYSDPEKNIAWIEERFPGEGHKARKYYELEDRIEAAATAWGVTKVLPERIPVAVRDRIYQATGGVWTKYMARKTREVFCGELGFSEKLASVFSYMYGNHGRTPAHSPFAFHAVNLFHFRYGAYYPVGGPGQIAECVVPIVEGAGGQVAVSCPVKRILVEHNTAVGVELESGEKIYSPLVISDVGAWGTFMDLLEPEIAERHGYRDKLATMRPSVAHLYLWLGYDEAIDLPQRIAWHMPSYDIEAFDEGYKKRMDFDDCLAGYTLSFSARDPVYYQRYPGKTTVMILNELPHEWLVRSRSDPEFKRELQDKLVRHFEPIVLRHYPQLEGKKPVIRKAGFPYAGNPRAWESNSLGIEPSCERFLEHTHWLRPETKVRNLYMVGQDSFSPGVCGSMFSARIVYSVITGNWPFSLTKKPF